MQDSSREDRPARPGGPPPEDAPITRLLQAAAAGETQAPHELIPLIYEHLRTVARALMAQERGDHLLRPTALVHEAYLKVFGGAPVDWNDRTHFFNSAARAMRFILVDHARAALAGRGGQVRSEGGASEGAPEGVRAVSAPAGGRGGPRRPLTLPENVIDQTLHDEPGRIVELEDALLRFEKVDPRAAQVVVWRFYNGMTIEQIASATGCAVQTVNRDWKRARAWLADSLRQAKEDDAASGGGGNAS